MKILLVTHGQVTSKRVCHDLEALGRQLDPTTIIHSGHSGCRSADKTLRALLRGAKQRSNRLIQFDDLRLNEGASCCEDRGINPLRMKPPTVETLMRADRTRTEQLSGQLGWRFNCWRRRCGPNSLAVLVLDPLTVGLITFAVCRHALTTPLALEDIVEITWSSNGQRRITFPKGHQPVQL